MTTRRPHSLFVPILALCALTLAGCASDRHCCGDRDERPRGEPQSVLHDLEIGRDAARRAGDEGTARAMQQAIDRLAHGGGRDQERRHAEQDQQRQRAEAERRTAEQRSQAERQQQDRREQAERRAAARERAQPDRRQAAERNEAQEHERHHHELHERLEKVEQRLQRLMQVVEELMAEQRRRRAG